MFSLIRMVRLMMVLIAGPTFCGILIYMGMRDIVVHESEYRQAYGEDWQRHYEANYGPVSEGRKKIAIGGAGVVVIFVLGYLVYRQSMGSLPRRSRRSSSSRSRQQRKMAAASRERHSHSSRGVPRS